MNKELKEAIDAVVCATVCDSLDTPDLDWGVKRKLHAGIQAAIWDYTQKKSAPNDELQVSPIAAPITAQQAHKQTEALQAHRNTLAGVMEYIDLCIVDAIDCGDFETSWAVEANSAMDKYTLEVHRLLLTRNFRITITTNMDAVECRKKQREIAIQRGRHFIPKELKLLVITNICW